MRAASQRDPGPARSLKLIDLIAAFTGRSGCGPGRRWHSIDPFKSAVGRWSARCDGFDELESMSAIFALPGAVQFRLLRHIGNTVSHFN